MAASAGGGGSGGGTGEAPLISLTTFANSSFNTKDFVNSLTFTPLSLTKLTSGTSSGATSATLGRPTSSGARVSEFDAKPFIHVFENALADLVKVRKRVLRNIEELEDAQTAADNVHKTKLGELNRSFQGMYTSFRTLESRIGDVGNTAVKIGEQLETIDKQRANAAEAKELITLFFDFNNQDTGKMEVMRQRMGADGQYRAAVIARRLMQISREVDIPGTEQARLGIEKYCELLETDLLRTFQDAYEQNDVKAMSECAKVLYEFNGGNSCMQAFVNQHSFFTLQFHVGEIDPHTATQPNYGLVKMFQQLRATVYQDWDVVSVVFTNAPQVIQSFLQRVFAQSVQTYAETLLDKALAISTLTYLRVLTGAHRAATQLAKDFSHFDEQVLLPYLVSTGVVPSSSAAAVAAAANASGAASATGASTAPAIPTSLGYRNGVPISFSINIAVQRCMEDLFVPFVDGARYLDKETRCMSESIDSVLTDFNTYYLNRKQAAKKSGGVFARLNTTYTASVTGTNKTSAGADEGTLAVDTVIQILKMHVDAVSRCVELSDPSDVSRSVGALFTVLVDHVGKRYAEVALDAALEDNVLDGKSEPDYKCLGVVQTANTVVHLLQAHFHNAILPMVASSPMYHRELVANKNAVLSRLESRINILVTRIIDGTSTPTIMYLSSILAKQKKTDFKPKEDSIEIGMNTQPCLQACDTLKRVQSSFSAYFDGKNLEAALSSIGVAFHEALMDHFQRFPVSTAGSLVVTKDLAKYQETVAQFKIPQLNERLDLLRELGNLFLVRPENLRLILDEGRLARLDHAAIYPYLSMRMDFKSARIDVLLRQREQRERFDASQQQLAGDSRSTSAAGLGGSMDDNDDDQLGSLASAPPASGATALLSPTGPSRGMTVPSPSPTRSSFDRQGVTSPQSDSFSQSSRRPTMEPPAASANKELPSSPAADRPALPQPPLASTSEQLKSSAKAAATNVNNTVNNLMSKMSGSVFSLRSGATQSSNQSS
ncbi:Exocyst complex component 5 [Sorochytrium milnesiophthora]